MSDSDRLLNKLNVNISLPNKQQEAINEQIKEHERIAKEEAQNRGRTIQEQQSTEKTKRVTKFYCYHCEVIELTKLMKPREIKGLAKPIYKPRWGCSRCHEVYCGLGYDLLDKDGIPAIVSTLII
jgi:hypothetical protein